MVANDDIVLGSDVEGDIHINSNVVNDDSDKVDDADVDFDAFVNDDNEEEGVDVDCEVLDSCSDEEEDAGVDYDVLNDGSDEECDWQFDSNDKGQLPPRSNPLYPYHSVPKSSLCFVQSSC